MFDRILRDANAGAGAGGGGAPNGSAPAAAAGTTVTGSAPIFTQGGTPDEAARLAAQKSSEDFVKSIPEAYRDKPYLKGIDSPDKLFSAFDGAQKLIGSKPNGVPAADAPKEQWDAFYKSMGRPDAPDAYVFKPTEGLKYNDGFVKTVKGAFHEAGLNAKQAEIIQTKVDQALIAAQKEAGAAAGQADVDFDKLAETTFGAEKDSRISRAKAIMQEHAPQELLKHLGTLTNENLVIMAGVIDSIATKFIAPDKMPNGGQGGQGGSPLDMNQRREEARRLMLTPAFTDPFHPDHEKTKKQVNEMYSPLRPAVR